MPDKYVVYVPQKVKKSLEKIPDQWHKKIFVMLSVLEENPFLGEKMHGKLSDMRKIRIWPYRIIYYINQEKQIIEIREIAHRGNVSY